VVFLDLSATWCPICRTLAAQTDSIVDPYAFDGVDVVTVLYENQQGNDPTVADLNAWEASYSVTHALVRDVGRTVRNQWGGTGQPQLAIIDREGRVTWRQSGYPGRNVVQTQIGNALTP
jgi:thiol-disulfide isomerase/thioredoxin